MRLDKNKKYVVACSFGPDSMYLVNFCLAQKLNFIVAHVNYHRRAESNFEEESLRKFCLKNKLILEVLDTTTMKPKGNFQKWARNIRYSFFNEVCKKYQCDGVLVAHNQDDVIETFFMQKEKNAFVSYYGIKEITTIENTKILRPLLNQKKSYLLSENIKNNIPFSIDSSNLENHYHRNQIRHNLVEKLSDEERTKIIQEIGNLNQSLKIGVLHRFIWDLQEFLQLSTNDLIMQLSHFLQSKNAFKILEKKEITNIVSSFKSKKPNIEIPLHQTISIFKCYDSVILVDKNSYEKYEYIVEQPGVYSFKNIDLDFSSGGLDRNVQLSDYPLTIKPLNKKGNYKIANYSSNIRRLFIDWKMPVFLRPWWPGIYNKNGNLIYIPRYRETYSDNHQSKFIIKFPTK